MNCDQVFDVLTRGPFPTGTDCDEPVETHLSQCAACHRLAEALRPALELFQEAVDPEESRDLPGYWSTAATDRHAVVSYAPEVESRRAARLGVGEEPDNPSSNWSALVALRMAAMLAVGVTLGLLVSARSALDGFDWSPSASDADPAPLAAPPDQPKSNLADRLQLAALPAACRRSVSDDGPPPDRPRNQLLSGGELARFDCCSGCHNAQSETAVPAAATVKVAGSCQLCHSQRRLRQYQTR